MGLNSAWPCVKTREVELCAHCLGHWKFSQLAPFQGDGPEWRSHQEDSTVQYSQIWIQPTSNFILGALLQYNVYIVLTIIIFLGWSVKKKRIKIHHIVLATVRNK